MAELSGFFADHLRRRRQDYNDRFVAARMAAPALDGEALLDHLAGTVAPVVDAVAVADPAGAAAAADALYAVSLELLGRDLVGPRCRQSAVNDGWRHLLAAFPVITVAEADAFARAITNAIHAICAHGTADPSLWLGHMAAVEGQAADLATLLDCGVVAAWRIGMAQYREAALNAAERLPAALVAALLRLPPASVPGLVEAWRGDPWAQQPGQPGRVPRRVATVGGFRGFGGPFLTPPVVVSQGRRLVAFDAERAWTIVADRFGATLLPDTVDDYDADPPADRPSIDRRGQARFGHETAQFRDLADPASFASDGTTLAVTLPLSHHVHLLALA